MGRGGRGFRVGFGVRQGRGGRREGKGWKK